MAGLSAPTNKLLTAGLTERVIPIEVRGVVEMRSVQPVAALARLGPLNGFAGKELERFALREGRGRELLIYTVERAARHLKAWRARGFRGPLYIPLHTEDLEDRTLATSFDIIAKSQNIEQSSLIFVIGLSDYLTRGLDVSAIMRVRKAGCGVALSIDGRQPPKFMRLGPHPFTAAMVGGKEVWKRLRTIGPGRLGALGAWIGWAESQGLERTALGLVNATEQETARLYGFSLGEGPHYSDFMPARTFITADGRVAGDLESAVISAFTRREQPQAAATLRRA